MKQMWLAFPGPLLHSSGQMASHGVRIATGTIVDATLIAAPNSTKNEKRQRDPAMHQTRKGNQYYFGAKAHIGGLGA